MKKTRKIASIMLAIIITLIAGVLLFIQTPWFKSILKKELLKVANQQINGTLYLEKISGNFITHLEFSGLTLLDDKNDTLASFDKLHLEYSPSELISGRVIVDRIYLDYPRVFLKQTTDSTWNFDNILKPIEPDTTTTESEEMKLTFWFHRVRLNSGNIFIQSADTLIPASIKNLQLNLSGLYTSKQIMAHIKNFSFVSQQPDVELKSLHFNVKTDYEQWWVTNFYMETGKNNITFKGRYKDLEDFEASLNWQKIYLNEFSAFMPPIVFKAQPDMKAIAKAKNQQTTFGFSLVNKNEIIKIQGGVEKLTHLLTESSKSVANLNLDIHIEEFSPHHWVEMEELPLVLNADFNIDGNGLAANAKPLRLKGKLDKTTWAEHKIESSLIEGTYHDGKTQANIELQSSFGELSANIKLNLNHPEDEYKVHLISRNLALHQLFNEELDSSIVSLDVTASGKGIGTNQLDANFSGVMSNSIVEYIPIDTLQFMGSFLNSQLVLDSLHLINESVVAFANGLYDMEGSVQGNIKLDMYNLSAFTHYFDQPTQWEDLKIEASAKGTLDTLKFETTTQINHLTMDSLLSLQELSLHASGDIIHYKPYLNASLESKNIISGDLTVGRLNIDAQLNDTLWNVDVSSNILDEVELTAEAAGNLAETINISLSKLNIKTVHNHLQLSNSAQITYGDSTIQVEKLHIIDTLDSTFLVSVDAKYNKKDSILLTGNFSNINFETLYNYGLMEEAMKGRVDFYLHLEGYEDNILLEGETTLKEFALEPLLFKNIGLRFNYHGDSLLLNAAIYSEEEDSITLTASLPLEVSFKDSISASWDNTFKAELIAKGAYLKNFLTEIEDLSQPEAILNIDVKASGTTANPHIKGFINIDKGTLPMPKYGINYKEILLRLTIDDNKINMDSFHIRQKGYFLAQGTIEMEENLTSGKIASSNLTVKAREFYLSQHRNHEVQINSDLYFEDKSGTSEFGGNIKILRSSFNIDALTEMGTTDKKLDEPLLIQALKEGEDPQTDSKETTSDTITIKKETPDSPDFIKHLTGSLKLEIPRNTWLKSDDMQMEVYGNIDVVKNDTYFELFGPLGIHRGFYTFYGKKMVIEKGEFIFTGGEEFDPILNIKANYTFRTQEREKRVLSIIVSDNLSDPNIGFELDNQMIPEADAIAYILFGQPFDQLNRGNQEGVSDALSTKLLSSLVTNQLAKTLGKTLRLDMIEIDAADNWQNTTFMVGKYITNDLFVTYQRSFGESDEYEISPQTITLEYEITKRLSLRLLQGKAKESGVDFIIKLER